MYERPTRLVCTPVPYLPLLFQGVSASGLPTKSISFDQRRTYKLEVLRDQGQISPAAKHKLKYDVEQDIRREIL